MANGLPEGVDLDALIAAFVSDSTWEADANHKSRNNAAIVLALRVLKIVAQPSDEQRQSISVRAWDYRQSVASNVFTAILDMARENPDGR